MGLFNSFPLKIEKEVSKRSMSACESIIAEMGAELHDDLIQRLSVLRLHIDKIERSSFDPKETQEAIIKMQADFEHIVDSVRRISRRLHPVHMDGDDFLKRLDMLCQNLDTPGTVRITHSHTGTPVALDQTKEIYLLRIIQELIHNSFRHSSAWHVWITIEWTQSKLTINVEDDGSGFSRLQDFIERLKKKHNTIRMRAEAIGASVKYKTGSNGLLATIQLPL